jgi:hypothetical protein
MKRLLLAAVLLGSVSVARAQENTPAVSVERGNAATDFSTTSGAQATLVSVAAAPAAILAPSTRIFAAPAATTAAQPSETAEPAAASPEPKFLYGGRDDYRWELSLGAIGWRFHSSQDNASAVGVNTSVTYYLNDWLGVEGNFTEVFAPTILLNEHVKIGTYGGGAKIAWRQKKWEPWLHGLFGGAHEQPQFAGFSKNTYMAKLGGGADFRWNPRISFRLEANYVRTGFFNGGQDTLQGAGGIVFHF